MISQEKAQELYEKLSSVLLHPHEQYQLYCSFWRVKIDEITWAKTCDIRCPWAHCYGCSIDEARNLISELEDNNG